MGRSTELDEIMAALLVNGAGTLGRYGLFELCKPSVKLCHLKKNQSSYEVDHQPALLGCECTLGSNDQLLLWDFAEF